jgi:hypothetical protein
MSEPEHRYCADDMLTVEQLCQRLPETTPGMVYRWAGCPRYRTGKRNLYMWGEVLAYLRDRTATPVEPVLGAPRRAAAPVGEVFSLPHRTGRPDDSLFAADRGTFTPPRPPAAAERRDRCGAPIPPPPDAA